MKKLGEKLAKLLWEDPITGNPRDYVLMEGVAVTVGRSDDNDICIPDRRVSRRHATIYYKHGVFLLDDMGSSNGVFVNEQRVLEPYPLIHGDVIRLYIPTIAFSALDAQEIASAVHVSQTMEYGEDQPVLLITAGAQQGTEISIYKNILTFGRATSNATWDITLRDHAVSRPHAKVEMVDGQWYVTDLGSVNGTLVNGIAISQPNLLKNGDVIVMGETHLLFRTKSAKK